MGRVKVELKKIENKTYRHITFAKRKSGLVKKAYELSTLCDVEVALVMFSPAGKLFLFDGKKRVEEIFAHYLELPARQRGWVENQELIRRIITEMKRDAAACSYNHSKTSRTNKPEDIDFQLQEIQKEILLCSTQLEDVEQQLQYFLRNPKGAMSMSEVKYHEMILEDTLKLVQFRKRILEANCGVQPTSQEFEDIIRPHLLWENGFQATKTSPEGLILQSLSYNLMSLQSQEEPQAPRTFTQPNALRLSRNLPGHLVENLPSSMTYFQGHRYLAGNEVTSGQPKVEGGVYHPASGIDANFPPRMDIIKQARGTGSAAVQCEFGSSVRTTFFGANGTKFHPNIWFLH